MRWLIMALTAGLTLPAQGRDGTEFRIDFSNPGLNPPAWTLELHPDGSGHFHADSAKIPPEKLETMEPATIDRDVQLSGNFTEQVFQTVHKHKRFNDGCESHLKVAFQGWKKLSYSGPDGQGTCEFNYSKDRDIQSLGESFVAVASTIIEGARLELLRQHDPLGLDQEMEYMMEAVGDGRLQQIGAIQGILQKLQDDPAVMERVRRRARTLLAQSGK